MIMNISDLNRDELFEMLWSKASPMPFYPQYQEIFDLEKSKNKIDDNGFANIIHGRVIKSKIYYTDTVDPTLYDHYNGFGTFALIVAELRTK